MHPGCQQELRLVTPRRKGREGYESRQRQIGIIAAEENKRRARSRRGAGERERPGAEGGKHGSSHGSALKKDLNEKKECVTGKEKALGKEGTEDLVRKGRVRKSRPRRPPLEARKEKKKREILKESTGDREGGFREERTPGSPNNKAT